MTVEQLRATDKEILLPADIAPVLGVNPQWIRVVARTQPEKLGFPVLVVGTRTKIPRVPFLRWLGVEV